MSTLKNNNIFLIFLGFFLILIGAFFAYTSTFWYMPGSGRTVHLTELLIGIITIIIGLTIMIFTIKGNKQRIPLLLIIFILIASLFYNVYYVINLDDGYKPSPYFICEINSFNDSENMIKWTVIETFGTIKIQDIDMRLRNSINESITEKSIINYVDNDSSNSITKKDIIEVYAPDDGKYIFEIINTDNIVFLSDDNY